MRVVLYADYRAPQDELFRYVHAWVKSRFPDTHVVRVRRTAYPTWRQRWSRKTRAAGFAGAVRLVLTAPIQRVLLGRDARATSAALATLPRPDVPLVVDEELVTTTVNGPDAVTILERLKPDVLVQAGAGILQPAVFRIPRLGTLNMHHGIAPLIRGVTSLYWAIHEKRPEWVGATIHRVDAGIDTGEVLAYAHVEMQPGDGYPSLFARVTRSGVAALLQVLDRLQRGEVWVVPPAQGAGRYRSTIDGWRLLVVELRRKRLRTLRQRTGT